MEVQRGKIEDCKVQQETLTERLKNSQATHETLKKKVEDLSRAYEESKEATGEDSEETKKLKDELQKAEKQLANNESQTTKTEAAIKRQEAAVTKANAELAEMEVQLREVNAELARQKFDSYAEKAGKVGSALEGAGRIMTRASVAIAGVATAAVKTTADFEAGAGDQRGDRGRPSGSGRSGDPVRGKHEVFCFRSGAGHGELSVCRIFHTGDHGGNAGNA